MKSKLQIVAAAVVLATISVISTASAATYAFNNGDLLLGFTASSGTGQGHDLIIDLGTPTATAFGPNGFTLNIDSILTNTYGSSVYTSGYVNVAAFGAQTNNSGAGIGGIWINQEPNTSPGAIGNISTVSGFSSGVVTAGDNILGVNAIAANVTVSSITTNGNTFDYMTYTASQQNPNSWSTQDQLSTPWGGLNNNLEQGYYGSNTLANSEEFSIYFVSTNGSTQNLLGDINFNSNGTVTIPAAVPEPTTYALMGLGALLLVIAYRRRIQS